MTPADITKIIALGVDLLAMARARRTDVAPDADVPTDDEIFAALESEAARLKLRARAFRATLEQADAP